MHRNDPIVQYLGSFSTRNNLPFVSSGTALHFVGKGNVEDAVLDLYELLHEQKPAAAAHLPQFDEICPQYAAYLQRTDGFISGLKEKGILQQDGMTLTKKGFETLDSKVDVGAVAGLGIYLPIGNYLRGTLDAIGITTTRKAGRVKAILGAGLMLGAAGFGAALSKSVGTAQAHSDSNEHRYYDATGDVEDNCDSSVNDASKIDISILKSYDTDDNMIRVFMGINGIMALPYYEKYDISFGDAKITSNGRSTTVSYADGITSNSEVTSDNFIGVYLDNSKVSGNVLRAEARQIDNAGLALAECKIDRAGDGHNTDTHEHEPDGGGANQSQQQLPDIGVDSVYFYTNISYAPVAGGNDPNHKITEANTTDKIKLCAAFKESNPGEDIYPAVRRTVVWFDGTSANTVIHDKSETYIFGGREHIWGDCYSVPQELKLVPGPYISTVVVDITSNGRPIQENNTRNNVAAANINIIGAQQPPSFLPPSTLDIQKVKQYAPTIIHDSRPDTQQVPLYTPYDPHTDDEEITNNHENFDTARFPKENVVQAKVINADSFSYYEYIYERANNPHWAGIAWPFAHEHDVNIAIVKVDKQTGRPVALAVKYHELGWQVKQVSKTSDLAIYSEWGSHEFATGQLPTANGDGPALTKDNIRFMPLEDRLAGSDIDAQGFLRTNEPHYSIKGVKAPWLMDELKNPENLVFKKYSAGPWQQSAMWFELHSPATLEVIVDGKTISKDTVEMPKNIFSGYSNNTIGIIGVDVNTQPKVLVHGTGNGTIHLSGYNINGGKNTPMFQMTAPIRNGEVYEVTPDWQAIADGSNTAVQLRIDADGNGVFEKTMHLGNNITAADISGPQASAAPWEKYALPAVIIGAIGAVAGFLGFNRRRGNGPANKSKKNRVGRRMMRRN